MKLDLSERKEEFPSNRPQSKWSDQRHFFALAFIAALLLFVSQHKQGLAGYDDALYAHEGKEMVRTGDWWNVRFNGQLNFEYPPLFLWLEAGSFKLLGVSDSAAKFPSALLGLGTIIIVYFLTWELTGQSWLALLSMLILVSTQFFLKNATHAMTDVPFTFFFTLTMFMYVKGLKDPRYLMFLGAPLALALLTRSVIGFLAVGVFVAHTILIKRWRVLLSPWLLSGLVFAVAIPLSWYLSQYHLHGPEVFASHFRFVANKIYAGAGLKSSVLNYPLALFKYYWPWLPFMIGGFCIEVGAFLRGRDEGAGLLLIWVILILVPFSLIQTRYPRYIMPVFPAFSILAAIALHRLIPLTRRKAFLNFACIIGCVAVALTVLFPPKSRALDIRTLVPVVETNSSPTQRIVIYSYEDGRSDYLNQFLWYSSRFATLAPTITDLEAMLTQKPNEIVITDKRSYETVQSETGQRTRILGQSENLVCFRSF